jgi:hypothetical protein
LLAITVTRERGPENSGDANLAPRRRQDCADVRQASLDPRLGLVVLAGLPPSPSIFEESNQVVGRFCSCCCSVQRRAC